MTRFNRVAIFVALVLLAWAPVRAQNSLRFDGTLTQDGKPANGPHDFWLQLFDNQDTDKGEALGSEIFLTGVPVRTGRFEVELVFESNLQEAWLEIAIARSDGLGRTETLQPRQRITSNSESKSDTTFPGMVTFFNLSSCPSGWSAFNAAAGRVLVGLNPQGTLAGTRGSALADLSQPLHTHQYAEPLTTLPVSNHNHIWAWLTDDKRWRSYNNSGSAITVIDWGNGIGNEGSGWYPLAASAIPYSTFYTNQSGSHSHSVEMNSLPSWSSSMLPYLQLLVCIKD